MSSLLDVFSEYLGETLKATLNTFFNMQRGGGFSLGNVVSSNLMQKRKNRTTVDRKLESSESSGDSSLSKALTPGTSEIEDEDALNGHSESLSTLINQIRNEGALNEPLQTLSALNEPLQALSTLNEPLQALSA